MSSLTERHRDGALEAKLTLFPAWNVPKRHRNMQRCVLGVCAIIAVISFAIMTTLAYERQRWSYGVCNLEGFSDPCHHCYETPGWQCSEKKTDSRLCQFVVKAIDNDGGSEYRGLHRIAWQSQYLVGPGEQVDLRPRDHPFRCCPIEDTCCSWMFDKARKRFCDAKCFETKRGWPCRFRITMKPRVVHFDTYGDAGPIEYYVEPDHVTKASFVCLTAAVCCVVIWRDPLRLHAVAKPEPPKPAPPKRPKLRIVAFDDPEKGAGALSDAASQAPSLKSISPTEKKSPLATRWTPRKAAAALAPILSPLKRRSANWASPTRKRPGAPRSLDEWETVARPREQTALARADWARAQRQAQPAQQPRSAAQAPRATRSNYAAWVDPSRQRVPMRELPRAS